MLKKIFAIAVIALASSGVNAVAQKEVKIAKPTEYKAEGRIKPRPDCSVQRPGDVCGTVDRLCPKTNDLFKGIELSADQKAKLEKMSRKEAAERAKHKEKVKKERAERREKHDKEVKKILTPAQYEQYKANVKEVKAKCDDKKHCVKDRKHGKHGKHAKGHRCDTMPQQ